ncbi:hypothetical protein K458DRAFT_475583 [Lentithecium fluviatile CBS 122367]|uniref:Uncharacterized protein n=1 Tax=Lentithecium fluviatile CBS 122367 TaxID=1168545 RepID=A0A6G1JAT3_9PLEO|nr:hypothetical protein K458DRAFT_475583 [Lentithecium fluviatile CBS 122367]
MAGFIQNILWNSVSGFVEAGTRTAGGYAGDALIKAGDLVENGGRSVGTGIERKASNYGSAISGQTYQPSAKALPSTAHKPVVKRSNSLPASAPTTKSVGKTPIGGNKYPGGKLPASTATAKKAITSVGARSSSVGGGGGGAKSVAGGAQKSLSNAGSTVAKSAPKTLPKPYSPNNTSSSYSNPFPGGEKKSAVKPGQAKPFNTQTSSTKAPYPGTNTLPGQASKTPVKAKSTQYKAAPRMAAPAERGKVQHISI